MNAVSLFAGVGGFDLACERNGIKVAAAVEIDKAARKQLRKNFPYTAIYEDVTRVHSADLCPGCDNCLPGGRIGLVAAGWPCQDLSVAGRRLGLGGKRSGLWWEVVRILAELRPTWFIGENVPGLLSACCPCPGDGSCRAAGLVCGGEPHTVRGGVCPGGCMATHGGAMGAVLGSLAELGYGVAYRVLDAQFFGLPQQRPRVILVGHSREWTAPAEVLLEPESSDGHLAASGATGPRVAADSGEGTAFGLRTDLVSTLQGGGVGATGSTPRRQRAVTSSRRVATLVSSGPPGTRREDESGLIVTAHALTSEGADASEDGTGRGTPLVTFHKSRRAQTSDDDESWVEDDRTNTLNTFDGGDTRATSLIVGVGLHGELSGGTDDIASSTSSHGQPGGVTDGIDVRRLTPLECERLQGFPDNWTDGQADAPRYRQMGNAVAVPVVEWVIQRLVEVDSRLAQIPGDRAVLHEHPQGVHEVGAEAVVTEVTGDASSVVPERVGDANVA